MDYPTEHHFNLALGHDITRKTLKIVFGAVIIGGLGLVAFVIVVITLILRTRAQARARQLGLSP